MENDNHHVSKYTISFGLSLALCSVLNALLVIAKEKSPAVLSAMQKLPGRHWTAHVAIMTILFLLFGCLFAILGKSTMPVNKLITTIISGVITGCLLIIGFYLITG